MVDEGIRGEGKGRWSEKEKDNFPNEFLVVDKNFTDKAIQEHGRKIIGSY